MPEPWSFSPSQEMDEEQFHLWQALLEDRTGMQMSSERKRFLETSISIRMREIGLQEYGEYYEKLVGGPKWQVEWATFVDRITVQETRFFRHESSYDLLKQFLLLKNFTAGDRTINIWSVGCATGEEPYSIAMAASEVFSKAKTPVYYGITATDISLIALNKARQGIYTKNKVALINEDIRKKYFTEVAPEKFQVNSELRDHICFACINVLDLGSVPFKDLDVIYCQNLLIYFSRWRKRQIVNALVERLRPGGLLVLGLGEVLENWHPELKQVPFENTLAFTRQVTPG